MKYIKRFHALANDEMRIKILKMAEEDFCKVELTKFLDKIRPQTRGFRKEFKAWCDELYQKVYRGY
jgi:hypothetical protein